MKFNPAEKLLDIQRKLDTNNEQYLFAAISYLLFLSLIVLFLKHDDPFIKYHAKQGFILFILALLAFPFWSLPRVVGLNIGWAPNLLVAVLILIGMFKALAGQSYNIPFITKLSERIKI